MQSLERLSACRRAGSQSRLDSFFVSRVRMDLRNRLHAHSGQPALRNGLVSLSCEPTPRNAPKAISSADKFDPFKKKSSTGSAKRPGMAGAKRTAGSLGAASGAHDKKAKSK
eukprot:594652-Pleurochrysis_carterae.AAC.1